MIYSWPVFNEGKSCGFRCSWKRNWASQVVLVVKNPSANAGDIEIQVWSLGWEDRLEEGIAIHSGILPGESAWTEEPSGLQSTGSQRVRHDWSDYAQAKFQKTTSTSFQSLLSCCWKARESENFLGLSDLWHHRFYKCSSTNFPGKNYSFFVPCSSSESEANVKNSCFPSITEIFNNFSHSGRTWQELD